MMIEGALYWNALGLLRQLGILPDDERAERDSGRCAASWRAPMRAASVACQSRPERASSRVPRISPTSAAAVTAARAGRAADAGGASTRSRSRAAT